MDIPEDVRERAIAYWVDATQAGKPGDTISTIDLISRAIADERERSARVCEHQAHAFLSPEYAADQPLGSFSERFACASCADAIRTSPNQTGEVDRT